MRFIALGLVAVAACAGKKQPEPASDPTPAGTLVRGDGGVTAVASAVGPTGMHMDDGIASSPVEAAPQPTRPGRSIDVTLRSTPPGAQVAVDGTVVGTTPAFWNGMADGREHEFVFTMRGYAIARYRFVPVASGVIHGRLDPIREDTDAGVAAPPPEVMAPHPPAAPTINVPAPPATVTVDAAVGSPTPGSAEPPVGPQP